MGLDHVFAQEDRSRALCQHCGRAVHIDPGGDERCPDCGSTDLLRVALL